MYPSNSTFEIFRAWSRWENIEYNHDLNAYINEVELGLAGFRTIGAEVSDQMLACSIIARLGKQNPALKDNLFYDLLAGSKTKEIIQKLRLISRHEIEMVTK
jgi:hypothetical protein